MQDEINKGRSLESLHSGHGGWKAGKEGKGGGSRERPPHAEVVNAVE